jgi:hypothetical protein
MLDWEPILVCFQKQAKSMRLLHVARILSCFQQNGHNKMKFGVGQKNSLFYVCKSGRLHESI